MVKMIYSQGKMMIFTTMVLICLGGEFSEEGKRYIHEYDRQLHEHYPVTHTHSVYAHGENVVLFPFRRMFIVCRV